MTTERYPCYIQIHEEKTSITVELPTEKDGTILLSTIASQFPGAVGLRFKSPTGTWRGVRLTEANLFDPPLDGWGSTVYNVVMPVPEQRAAKRKIEEEIKVEEVEEDEEEEDESPLKKMDRMQEKDILSDLIVLSLPYEAEQPEVKAYFQLFGEIEFCEIKYDNNKVPPQPRGFGFIRYKTVEGVRKCLEGTHILRGRELDVYFANDKKSKDNGTPTKLFVGRLPKDVNVDELQEYFETFGNLKDCYIPTPFKGFGFVSFKKQSTVRKVLKATHCIKGQYINVSHPTPKKNEDEYNNRNNNNNNNNNSGFGNSGFRNQDGFGHMGGMRGYGGTGDMRGMFPGGMPPRGPQMSGGGMNSYYGFGFQGNNNNRR